jgi:hypothetical protein
MPSQAVQSPPRKCARHLRALVYTRTHWAEMLDFAKTEPPTAMKPKTVRVNDKMQRGYTNELVAPSGRGFAEGFEPELTPAEMLRHGVFGGKYMTDCRREFPKSWFARPLLHAAPSRARRVPAPTRSSRGS